MCVQIHTCNRPCLCKTERFESPRGQQDEYAQRNQATVDWMVTWEVRDIRECGFGLADGAVEGFLHSFAELWAVVMMMMMMMTIVIVVIGGG